MFISPGSASLNAGRKLAGQENKMYMMCLTFQKEPGILYSARRKASYQAEREYSKSVCFSVPRLSTLTQATLRPWRGLQAGNIC